MARSRRPLLGLKSRGRGPLTATIAVACIRIALVCPRLTLLRSVLRSIRGYLRGTVSRTQEALALVLVRRLTKSRLQEAIVLLERMLKSVGRTAMAGHKDRIPPLAPSRPTGASVVGSAGLF